MKRSILLAWLKVGWKSVALLAVAVVGVTGVAGHFQLNGSWQEEEALVKRAIAERNPNLCDQAQAFRFDGGDFSGTYSAQRSRNMCFERVAVALKDIDVCKRIDGHPLQENRSACMGEVWNATGLWEEPCALTEKICADMLYKGVGDHWSYPKCLKKIAGDTRNPSICDKYFKQDRSDWFSKEGVWAGGVTGPAAWPSSSCACMKTPRRAALGESPARRRSPRVIVRRLRACTAAAAPESAVPGRQKEFLERNDGGSALYNDIKLTRLLLSSRHVNVGQSCARAKPRAGGAIRRPGPLSSRHIRSKEFRPRPISTELYPK